jgi:hypothetical protein
MPGHNETKIIPSGTTESAAMVASVKRALAITPVLNRLAFDDADEIRALFSDLIGHKVHESFSLIPPFYTTGGENIRVGRNTFSGETASAIRKTCSSHLWVPQRRAAYLSRGALRDKTEDQKTFKILSRVTEGKQDRTGVVTSVVDGVSYLQELHTSNAKFVLQNGIEGSK